MCHYIITRTTTTTQHYIHFQHCVCTNKGKSHTSWTNEDTQALIWLKEAIQSEHESVLRENKVVSHTTKQEGGKKLRIKYEDTSFLN